MVEFDSSSETVVLRYLRSTDLVAPSCWTKMYKTELLRK